MGWIRSFYRSTVGKKVVMAVTGLIGVGFVCGHMLGNLLIFKGPEALNAYGELLKSSGPILWTVRTVLLVAIGLHVHAAYSLTMLNRAARPVGYDKHVKQSSTISATSLRVGGVVLLVFIVYHIMHFTTGTTHPAFSPGDAYGNVVIGFSSAAVVAFYLLAMVSLALHLHHGIWSFFQTMGWNHPHLNPARRRLATLLAIVVALGFSTIPLAVAFGLVQ
jgi:succinate dehydrogenase / fumarate reductase, cytochrome b subunit